MEDKAFDAWLTNIITPICQGCGKRSATSIYQEDSGMYLCHLCDIERRKEEMKCEMCNRLLDSKAGLFRSAAGSVCFACLNSLCVRAKTTDSMELEQLRRAVKLANEEKENIRNTWAKKYESDIRDLEAEKNTWEAAAKNWMEMALKNHDELIELKAAASEQEYAEQKLKEEIEQLHDTVDELGPEVAMLRTVKLDLESVIASLDDTIRNQEDVIKELRAKVEQADKFFEFIRETARRL